MPAIPKVKTILITQPKPDTEKSPYFDLAKKYTLKIDFRPFIQLEPISGIEFRKDKVYILNYSGIIFTSRNAVDHFFRICTEMRITIPESMKYFCMSDSIAFYLQKYVLYRKRKVFHGKQTVLDLIEVIKKHPQEKLLLPCTDVHKQEIPLCLKEHNIDFKEAVIYKTVCSDLSDLAKVKYDMLVFFTPSGVKSLLKNFPKFKQNTTRIAAFGPTTSQAVLDSGLRLDIQAPIPGMPSMTMAIEHYLKKILKQK